MTLFQASATVPYELNPLSKTMDYSSASNILPVSIVINPDGLTDFGAGTAGAPYTWVTAEDTLQNLSMFLNSVVFWTQTKNALGIWDGTWVQVPASQVGWNLSNQWSINAISSTQVDFVIPNQQPVKITYNVLVPPVTAGQSIPIGNSITIAGLSDSASNPSYTYTGSQGGANAGITDLRVFKQDALTGSALPGATFSLYAMRLDNPAAQPLNTTTPSDFTIGSVTETFYLVGTVTTGSNGIGTFVSNKALDNTADLLFVLVETAAPSGYLLPAAPANLNFFTINSAIPSGMSASSTDLWNNINSAVTVDRASDFVAVSDMPAATLIIEKYIVGMDSSTYSPQELTFLVENMNKMAGEPSIPPINFSQFTWVVDHYEYVLTGLEPGRYSIQENGGAVADYTMATPVIAPASVYLNYGDTATTSVTNTYAFNPPTDPTVTVRKVFHGLPDSLRDSLMAGYTITATGPDGFNVTLNLAEALAGVSYDLKDMSLGDYTITENNYLVDPSTGYNFVGLVSGYYTVGLPFTFTLSQDADGVFYLDGIPVPSEGETLVTFNNMYWPTDMPDPGELIITKAFEGLPAGEGYEDVSFLIQGFDAQNNEIYKETIPLIAFVDEGNGQYTTGAIMLPAGNYTVTELGGKALGAFDFQSPTPHQVTIVSDDVAVDQFVNKYTPTPLAPVNTNDPGGTGGAVQYEEDEVKTFDPFNMFEYDEMLMMSLACLGLVLGRKNVLSVLHQLIVSGPQNMFSSFPNYRA